MTGTDCLNCGEELTGKYCTACGQKADTHRISFKNFIFHDVLHGVFHMDRGMLFTAKEAFIRPGQAALDYIAGKRKRYYNVFYFILITIGLLLFLRHFLSSWSISDVEVAGHEKEYINEASRKMDQLFDQKSKLIMLLFLPFSAINSFILFRKRKLNLSEHTILSGMILLGILLLTLVGNSLFIFDLIIPFSDSFAEKLSLLITAIIIFHIGYGYYNAFSMDYTRVGISLKILSFLCLLILEIVILFFLTFGIFSDWKFGKISFSPFI